MEDSWFEPVLHNRLERIFVEMHAQGPDDPHIGGPAVCVYDQLNEANSLVVSLDGFGGIICLNAMDKPRGNFAELTRHLVNRSGDRCGRFGRVRTCARQRGAADKRSDGNVLNRAGKHVQKHSSASAVRLTLMARGGNTEQDILLWREQKLNLITFSHLGCDDVANPAKPGASAEDKFDSHRNHLLS